MGRTKEVRRQDGQAAWAGQEASLGGDSSGAETGRETKEQGPPEGRGPCNSPCCGRGQALSKGASGPATRPGRSTRPSLEAPRAEAREPSDLASAESMSGAMEVTRLQVRRSEKP